MKHSWTARIAALLLFVSAPMVPVHAADTATSTASQPWSIAVLPDTQIYSLAFPEVFLRQSEWLVANRGLHNIRFVLHEGDIVNNNTHPEWMNARRAMDALLKVGLPFVMAPGNHDMGDGGRANTRRSHFSDYFSGRDAKDAKTWGAFEPGRMDNTWHTFDTPWGPFLVLALEFGPRHEVVAWASGVARKHPDHRAILLTHAYLYSDSTRYDWAAKGDSQKWNPHGYGVAQDPAGVNDGEELWQKLVRPNANFVMTLNGHVLNDGVGQLCTPREGGPAVQQLLANYQQGVKPDRGFGGGGFLRLMTFQPDGRTVKVKTYSPWFDQWLTEADQEFEIKFDAWSRQVPPKSGKCSE